MPPPRSSTPELLDGPITDMQALAANMRDLRRSDALIGATRTLWRDLRVHLNQRPYHAPVTLLDVATGGADTPLQLAALAYRTGHTLRPFASDRSTGALRLASERHGRSIGLIRHEALTIPARDGAFDYVTCVLALHHFAPQEAAALLRELSRVARHAALLVDLRRTWAGYLGARLMALGPWDTMARHDGPLSVLRSYTPEEVHMIARTAGVRAEIHARGPLLISAWIAGSNARYGREQFA